MIDTLALALFAQCCLEQELQKLLLSGHSRPSKQRSNLESNTKYSRNGFETCSLQKSTKCKNTATTIAIQTYLNHSLSHSQTNWPSIWKELNISQLNMDRTQDFPVLQHYKHQYERNYWVKLCKTSFPLAWRRFKYRYVHIFLFWMKTGDFLNMGVCGTSIF